MQVIGLGRLTFTAMDNILSLKYLHQLDMCLWNTDAPGSNKVKLRQKIFKSYFFTPPNPQGQVMSVKCEEPIDELTVQV